MNNLPNQAKLELNYFEFGYLYASIKDDVWDRMPKSLWLKLKIISLSAYEKHPSFHKGSAKQLKQWRERLKKIEGGKYGKKSK